MGQFLKETVNHNGSRGVGSAVERTLPEGVGRTQSHRCQKVAELPEEIFTDYLADCRKKGEEPTTAGCIRLGKTSTQERRHEVLAGRAIELVEIRGEYPVLLADPPWRYEHCESPEDAIENYYPTMALEEICALAAKGKVPAASSAILFLWATAPKMVEAAQVLAAWGFDYRTNITWVKDKIGLGYYVRQRHEHLLIGRRGNFPVPLEADRPESVVFADRGRHSEKPAVIHEVIERMYPGFPKVELFQRVPRAGWHGYG